MRVTSKGQVTIPQAVREHLGITAGTEVDFEIDSNGARLVRRRDGRGQRVVDGMRGRATAPLTTEEIMALTRRDD